MPETTHVQITAPPGFFHNGTIYQSKGKWWRGSLVRFQQDMIKPVGGWQTRTTDATSFTGKARALMTWRDLSTNNWIAVGTSSHLYVQDQAGVNHDITPAGFTAGRDDATQNVGYGGATYGAGAYGAPATGTASFLPATVWSLDNFGQILVGVSDTDGKLYQWPTSSFSPATLVTGAPSCTSLVVTAE